MNTSWQQRVLPLLPHLLLMAAAFSLYAQSFGHQWTMDDYVVVARNTDIRSLKGFIEDSYPGRPLREITYLLDYQLFGDNPAGYHLQNIFWHGLNASLLVLVGSALGAAPVVAWMAGALFLVHPLNVEVVANISHRKESLMLTFSLLALLAFLRFYRDNRRWLWGVLGVTALGVASLAKQTAAGIVPIILGYEWGAVERSWRLVFRRPWVVQALIAVSVMAAAGWYLVVWQGEAFRLSMSECLIHMNIYKNWTHQLYLLFIFKALAFMFLRLLWPANLAMEYVFSAPTGWLDPWVLAGIGILILFGWLIWRLRCRPLPLMGVLMMLGFWLPVSNLLWPLSYFAADRYMYAVCAGFCLFAAWLASRLLAERRPALLAVWALLLVVLCGVTWKQNRTWADELALYRQAVAVSPESTKALMGMGIAHMNAGELEPARQWLEKAAANLNNSKTLYLLGLVHDKLGNHTQAIDYYRKFVTMNEPEYKMEILSVKKYLQMRYGISP